jgi:hypothetical protein
VPHLKDLQYVTLQFHAGSTKKTHSNKTFTICSASVSHQLVNDKCSSSVILQKGNFHIVKDVLHAAEEGAFSFLRTESLQRCAQSILRALLQPQSVSLLLKTLEQLSVEGAHIRA